MDNEQERELLQSYHVDGVIESRGSEQSDLETASSVSDGVKQLTYICNTCERSFSDESNLKRHQLTHPREKFYACSICQKVYTRNQSLKVHLKSHQDETKHNCTLCSSRFKRKSNLQNHILARHSVSNSENFANRIKSLEKRLSICKKTVLNMFSTYLLTSHESYWKDLISCFDEIHPQIKQLLEDMIIVKRGLKWYVVAKVQFSKINSTGEEDQIITYFRSDCQTELVSETISKHIDEAFAKITQSFEDFVRQGSGWSMDKIIEVELCSGKYAPLSSSVNVSKENSS